MKTVDDARTVFGGEKSQIDNRIKQIEERCSSVAGNVFYLLSDTLKRELSNQLLYNRLGMIEISELPFLLH